MLGKRERNDFVLTENNNNNNNLHHYHHYSPFINNNNNNHMIHNNNNHNHHYTNSPFINNSNNKIINSNNTNNNTNNNINDDHTCNCNICIDDHPSLYNNNEEQEGISSSFSSLTKQQQSIIIHNKKLKQIHTPCTDCQPANNNSNNHLNINNNNFNNNKNEIYFHTKLHSPLSIYHNSSFQSPSFVSTTINNNTNNNNNTNDINNNKIRFKENYLPSIEIRSLTGQTMKIENFHLLTLYQLKIAIGNVFQIPFEKQKIVFKGKVLKENESFNNVYNNNNLNNNSYFLQKHFGLNSGDTLYVLLDIFHHRKILDFHQKDNQVMQVFYHSSSNNNNNCNYSDNNSIDESED